MSPRLPTMLLALAFCLPNAAVADLKSEVESLLPTHVGSCVMVIRDGETILKHGYGVTKVEGGEPCTSATNFRMASITKQFTAAAVLLLADQGSLSLDDQLSKFFPDSPAYWNDISLHHVLTHTSGLPAYESMIPEGTTLQLYDQNVLEILLNTDEPEFAPGKGWEYSNSGYVLLGLVVEQASGAPFHRFMKEQVFEPLGMRGSRVYQRGLNTVPYRAYGHAKMGGKWVVADQSVTSALRGDGTVYSSLDDLEHWLRGLASGRLLSENSLESMTTPHVVTTRDDGNQSRVHYGYGWFLDHPGGHRRWMHGGATRGFRNLMYVYPDLRSAVVVLMNCEAEDVEPGVVQRIADRLVLVDSHEGP